MREPATRSRRVALFETCLVRLFRPRIVDACVQLLGRGPFDVVVPRAQACCGQPSYSGGDLDGARQQARQTISWLEGYDHVVVPSGSCAATMIRGYPALLEADPEWGRRAARFASRCHELSQFLSRADMSRTNTRHDAERKPMSVVWHDACTGLRDLGIGEQPRDLLAHYGFRLVEMDDPRACCGFGGAFAVKFPELSAAIGGRKADAARSVGANILTGPDLGCLLHLAGCLARQGSSLQCFHLAEVLSERTDEPGIGAEDLHSTARQGAANRSMGS